MREYNKRDFDEGGFNGTLWKRSINSTPTMLWGNYK